MHPRRNKSEIGFTSLAGALAMAALLSSAPARAEELRPAADPTEQTAAPAETAEAAAEPETQGIDSPETEATAAQADKSDETGSVISVPREPPPMPPLQLEVVINGDKTGLIGSFVQIEGGRLAARRAELNDVGIKVPGKGSADDIVPLDDILPAEAFKYDEPTQTLTLNLTDEQRMPKTFDGRASPDDKLEPRSDYGAVLNYNLFAAQTSTLKMRDIVFSGGSATMDGRVFSPYGTLSQTGILGTTTLRNMEALRLETTYSYSDPESLITYRGGDSITGSLNWTRAIRFGGVQVQRNFALRPDLVTSPLPTFSGSAAVPSTLDVYMDNIKTYTQQVPAGPFQINNLPLVSAGEAKVFLTDSTGRQVEATLPFYNSASLLREGMTYFSGEAGLPRVHYGTQSNDYIADGFAAVSARHGLYDWLTIEGHAEGSTRLYNGGVGAVLRLWELGTLSLAGSGSRFGNQTGAQAFAAVETRFKGFAVQVSTMRTLSNYNDLASATAPSGPSLTPDGTFVTVSALPPKAVDRLSISLPAFDSNRLSFTFTHLEPALASSPTSNIASVSWSRPLFDKALFFSTAFTDLSQRQSYGIFAGISIPLGDKITVGTGVSKTAQGLSVTSDANRPLDREPGSFGWRVRDVEGKGSTDRLAAGAYRSSYGTVEVGAEQVGNNMRGQATVQGGIATVGGGVFFSDRIDDGFAVVDTGVAGVDVMYENRPYGQTDSRGMLLIPNLQSYQRNKISIDPKNLPVNAVADQTQEIVAPSDRAGVLLKFGTKVDNNVAVVILAGPDGKVLPVGSKVTLEGGKQSFVVGYDGRAFIEGLQARNTAVVSTGGSECRASFDFTPDDERQVAIGPVTCQ